MYLREKKKGGKKGGEGELCYRFGWDQGREFANERKGGV